MVPFLGFPSLKITLEVLPLIVAGLTLQPGYCFIVSIATDFLGLVLANAGGFPFLGFTLNAVLQTEIPCLLKIYLNEKNERLLERIVKIVMVIISLLGCLYVFKINEVNISGSSYQVTLPIKFTIFCHHCSNAGCRRIRFCNCSAGNNGLRHDACLQLGYLPGRRCNAESGIAEAVQGQAGIHHQLYAIHCTGNAGIHGEARYPYHG